MVVVVGENSEKSLVLCMEQEFYVQKMAIYCIITHAIPISGITSLESFVLNFGKGRGMHSYILMAVYSMVYTAE